MKILIVGAGGMGRRHAGAILRIGGADVLCHDVDSSRLAALEADSPEISCYAGLGAIPVSDVDGTIIATPTHTHLDYMEWCVDNGLAFLVEKPIHIRAEGVAEVIDRVEGKSLVAGVAFPRRNARAVEKLKAKVADGVIGELKMLCSTFSQDFRKYRPDFRTTYYARLSTGGGILMDALSHHIDLVTYFAGPIKSVAAVSDRLVVDGVEGEDSAALLLRFESGVIGTVSGNQFQKPNVDRIELIGTDGNICYERLSGRMSWNQSDDVEWQEEYVDGNWDDTIQSQACNFLSVIGHGGGGAELRTSLSEGLHTLQVILAARESVARHSVVELA